MGEAKWLLGEEATALDLIDRAVDTAKQHGMSSFQANTLMVKGRILKGSGWGDESLPILRQARELAETIDNMIIKLEASLLIAEILLEKGDEDAVRDLAEESSHLCQIVKHPGLMERTEAVCTRLGLPFYARGKGADA